MWNSSFYTMYNLEKTLPREPGRESVNEQKKMKLSEIQKRQFPVSNSKTTAETEQDERN